MRLHRLPDDYAVDGDRKLWVLERESGRWYETGAVVAPSELPDGWAASDAKLDRPGGRFITTEALDAVECEPLRTFLLEVAGTYGICVITMHNADFDPAEAEAA